MKRSFFGLTTSVVGFLLSFSVLALEIITNEDIVQGIVVEDQLVRVADNAIFLIDTSSSMNDEFQDRGRSKLPLVLDEFKRRNTYFPDLGHRFGIYSYTPWEEIYPTQPYNRAEVTAALDMLSTEGSGPTPLLTGIQNAEEIIASLSGRTVLFLFYDGDFTGASPDPAIWRLVSENDVCLLMISSATDAENQVLQGNLARLNSCSRLIPLEYFLDRPEYTTHALYDVRATERVVTTTERRVSGLETKGIVFGFDRTELTDADKAELDTIAGFMADSPNSYAVLAGYTDNIGIEEYNEHLSRLRSEMVADYLADVHDIDESRLVQLWHGSDNPVASNDTEEGRARNRRVEVAVSGL